MLNTCCCAQAVKCSFEFSTIISANLGRIPKDLKHLFLHSFSYCVTGLILDDSQDTEFAETADGCQQVDFVSFWS